MKKLCLLLPFLFISSSVYALTSNVQVSRFTDTPFDGRKYLAGIQSTDTAILQKSAGLAQTSSQATIMNNNLATTQSNGLKALTTAGKTATVLGFLAKSVTGTLITYAVIEGGIQAVKYLKSNSNGDIIYQQTSQAPANSPAFIQNQMVWTFSNNAITGDTNQRWALSPSQILDSAVANVIAKNPSQGITGPAHDCYANGDVYYCYITKQDGSNWFTAPLVKVPAPIGCPDGQYLVGPSCSPLPGVIQTVEVVAQPQTLHSSLPQSHLEARVSPQSMADLVNAENTRQAQNPQNRALPPVTAQDVTNSVPVEDWPKVGDFTTPVAPGTEDTQPPPVQVGNQTSNTSNVTNNTWNETNTTTTTKVDLGPDPGITPPGTLNPDTPTGDSLFAPFMNLVPEFRHFVMTGPTGNCPTPSFQVKGVTYTIHQHCDLFEANRALFSNAMLFIFSIMSLIIIFTI